MQDHHVTGRTRLFGIIADPVHHVRTPQLLNILMRTRGVDGVMMPFHVRPDHLPAVFDALRRLENLGGFIVTVPHKSAAIALCDEVSEAARAIGAANAVRRMPDGRLIAEMLDGKGFVAGLQVSGIDVVGRSVYLAGAGGAANAIAFALAEAGIARLSIANRTATRVEDLRARLASSFPGLPTETASRNPAGHDLVVNATSLGLRASDPLPLDTAGLSPQMVVAEIIMQPEYTPLLLAAQAAGCTLQFGLPMLTQQLELMADFMGMTP